MDRRSLRPLLRYICHLAGQDLSGLDDHRLLDIFRSRRDEVAFAALVQRHGPVVLGVCRRVLHNEHDAEDAFQSTFLVLARKAGSIRRRESLDSWLYKVAYRLALRLRSRTAHQRAAEIREVPAPLTEADGDLSWRELRVVLDEELQKLPEKYRAPLVLCYLAGKTRDEAAEELGWTVGAVKGRLERGRRLLGVRLRQRGLTLSAALLATLLAQGEGATAMTAGLARVTARAAVAFASGSGVGTVPPQVLWLAEAGLQAMGTGSLKLAAALSLLLGCVGLGAAFLRPAPLTALPESEGITARPQAPALRTPAPVVERPQGPPFLDITRDCGLEAIVKERYAATPKWWMSGLHLVDLDGDGHLDFFMSAHGRGEAAAALNDGKGNFKLALGSYPRSEIHLAYDLDEDGRVDLSATFQDGGSKWWLNRSQPGMLQFEPTKIERGTNTARRQALIDLDRDGKVDWVRGVPNALAFDLADGRNGFMPGAATLRVGDTGRHETLCLPVDLDGDGHIDFLVEWGHYGNRKGSSRVYRNDGRGGFQDVTEGSGLSGMNMAIKGVADVNQDGSPDLLVLEDMKPEIYLNDGKGKFTRKPDAITGLEKATRPSMASWGIAVMTDFDNDGVPDRLWNGKYYLWVLRGTGDGRFRYMNREWGIKDVSASSVDDGLCFGDIDGDGMLDIVGYTRASDPRRFAVYRNNLPRQNWVRVRPIGQPGNKGAAGAKIRLLAPGTRQLLWYEQVAVYNSQSAQSYYGHAETERHYGLGSRTEVDVEVEFYPSGRRVRAGGVKANTTVKLFEGVP
ncbi:MAG TPA: sigma-70 family RNA polymerase sigma factor [Gemmataceae bacterium]|nr:sigma-70 family RNA polymerase sigma factor [Gemmataceae bacterium]